MSEEQKAADNAGPDMTEASPSSEASTESATAESATLEHTATEPATAETTSRTPTPEPSGSGSADTSPAATPSDTPVLVITAIASSGVRAADATMAHAKKFELVRELAADAPVSSVDFVELQISAAPFGALKNSLGVSGDFVALYDLLPLPDHLSPEVRRAAAQFVAAEKLWAFETQGMLNGIPLNVRLDLPDGWDRTPKAIHDRLLSEGALNLSEAAIEVFKSLQQKWNDAQEAELAAQAAQPGQTAQPASTSPAAEDETTSAPAES